VPALSLTRALRDGRVLGFLAVWFGLNIIFGIGSISIGAEGGSVAWQGPYRRLLRRPAAVFAVRSDPARDRQCCGCVIAGLRGSGLIVACGASRFHPSSEVLRGKVYGRVRTRCRYLPNAPATKSALNC